jgi:hypothetical protein
MEADVFPAYGHKPINAVTAADIRQLMIAVEKRDARDVAKRIHETTSQIFRFAIARDIASRNPAADFKPRDILAEAQTENRARVDARDATASMLQSIDTSLQKSGPGMAMFTASYATLCDAGWATSPMTRCGRTLTSGTAAASSKP